MNLLHLKKASGDDYVDGLTFGMVEDDEGNMQYSQYLGCLHKFN